MPRGRARAAAEAGPVEGPWALPEGWRWVRACDFARIIGGSTPKNAGDSANFDPAGIPWITPADLSGYTKSTIGRGRRSLSAHGRAKARADLLPTGTVLISSRAPVGYCAVAENPLTTNQGFRSLVLDADIDPFFVRYFVLASKEHLEARASGTTFKELSGSALAEILFPIPSHDVQRRIVARVDELFSEIDDGEAALRRVRADLDLYRRSLLKAAVTGELTADWRAANPPAETGADLLRRILADRRACWQADPKNKGKRYVEPAEPDTSGLPALPEGWAWVRMEQVIHDLRNGVSAKPDHDKSGTSILRISAVREMKVRLEDRRWLHPSIAVGDAVAQPGDLLFTRYNGSPELVGVCGLVRGTETIAYPDKLMRARPVLGDSLADYLELACNVGRTRTFIEAFTKTSAGQHGVSGSTIKDAPVPLPPLAEAVEITVQARADLSVAGQLAKIAADHVGDATALRQSILSAAFRGELAA